MTTLLARHALRSRVLLRCGAVVLLLALASGCTLPRVPVRQTFDRVTDPAQTAQAHRYRARAFAGLDTAHRLLGWEFLPVELAVITDDRDSVTALLVGAWQEYLWRFSERLAARDKEYFVPTVGSVARAGDSLTVTWMYPSVDNRDDDLRQVTPYRNSYWTVELFEPTTARELAHGKVRSHPQFAPYDPRTRFRPGGAYELGLPDSSAVMSIFRRELERLVDPARLED